MWTTREDRDRAAVLAEKLSPAQQRARAERERCFNGGYDAAIRSLLAVTRPEVEVNYLHPRYVERRHARFEGWDLEQRVAARKATQRAEDHARLDPIDARD